MDERPVIRRIRVPETHERSADMLATWLVDNADLLRGLSLIREFDDSNVAVAAILDVPALRRVVASWTLWDLLAVGDHVDPEALLHDRIGQELLTLAHTELGVVSVRD